MATTRLTMALAFLLVAGAAQAAPAPGQSTAGADQLNAAVRARPAGVTPPLPPGLAHTSLETRFARDATGAVGFLCGRGDSLDERAASSPLGSDPHGRFLGAKLSFAFH